MSVSDVVGDPGRTFEERPGLSRRQLVRAGAWAAPVIVLATAAPAAATSQDVPQSPTGTVPASKLRIENFRLENASQWDPVGKSTRGPIAIYIPIHYDQRITAADPASATVPWTVTGTGPLGSISLSGTVVVPRLNFQQQKIWYPSESARSLPAGTYAVTLTIYGSSGSVTAPGSVTL